MSAIRNVIVPDIGDLEAIPVIEILVKRGDRVTRDTSLVVLESDKATLDVPSPEDGIVSDVKVAIGTRVSAGSLLLTLEDASESIQGPLLGPVVQDPIIDSQLHVSADALSLTTTNENHRTHASEETQIPIASPGGAPARTSHGSPSIRRMAREFGIDLSILSGTGPRGRIVRQDLHKHIKNVLANAARSDSDGIGAMKPAPWPQIDFSKFGPIERAPLSRIRKLAAASLTRNAVVIPHVTNFDDADITELETFRKSLRREGNTADAKVTLLPFLIKAAAMTLGKYGRFNSSLDGDDLVMKRYCHVGFAADTPNGLVVPVIRDANSKGIMQIAGEVATLATQARDGTLKPADMQGGCFTISSLGAVAGTGFTPIINAPEVAILGVSRAQMRPIWNGNEFCPRLILPLMLSWDHRVVDGVAAALFLVYLSELLADLRKVLL